MCHPHTDLILTLEYWTALSTCAESNNNHANINNEPLIKILK